ncbi:hypothetical protein K2173_025857 [Erythroxylum novogranatense]|uniref:Glycosyltransferase n=1 Tax=Erythroxylum novogranatense TaxID=1862640 RepID=A0AAV8TZS4_9ROSI|nr:hypothetical protein K2173_025857 [Erythroxylum novogranatense]
MAGPKKLHVAMCPWLAFGHMMPFLELGKMIAQKGHRVSFISTTRNILRLPKLPPDIAPFIELVSLRLPHEPNLPDEAEATVDVPYHLVPYLKKAFDGLKEPLTQFLEGSKPDWIIYDFAHYWLPPIASQLGVSRAFFNIFNTWSICFFGPGPNSVHEPRSSPEDYTVPPKWVPFSTNLAFRLFEAKKMLRSQEQEFYNPSGVSDEFRAVSAMSGCELIAARSCSEFEGEWINLLQELYQKKVVPVGLMPPSVVDNGEEKDASWLHIIDWMSKQEKGSVVYIALGTEVAPSQDDITELALGLELSGLPFFWALRKDQTSTTIDTVVLPEGFEERTRGRGVVWTSWAPQIRILSHDAVGGFVTHCGWSSIIEGLSYGCALVLLPFQIDQGLNARILEEKKAGLEIPRDEEEGSFTRNCVAETLRRVMVNEEGQIYRDGAMEMKKIFGDKDLNDRYLDNFVQCLCRR